MAGEIWGVIEGREDLMVIIAQKLDGPSFARLGMCCKNLSSFADRDSIWKSFMPAFWMATKVQPIEDSLNRGKEESVDPRSYLDVFLLEWLKPYKNWKSLCIAYHSYMRALPRQYMDMTLLYDKFLCLNQAVFADIMLSMVSCS